jgi:phosphate transport system permease protein
MPVNIRKIEEYFFRVLMLLCTCIIALALLVIIFSILKKGLPSLSWSILTQTPKGGFYFGKEGGILNAIVGSLYLAFGATLISLLVGVPVALYMNVHLVKRNKLVNALRFLLDLLWGIPSIVYGAFAFSIMIYLGMRTSLLAGMLTVALFIIPITIRAMDEILRTVPRGLLEASLSVGATRGETAYKVFIRQSFPGLVTAMLLSFGRAIGDAAAVLFTAGFTDSIPTSIFQPTATLPLSIFFQLGSPMEEVKNRAYAAAVVLTLIVLILSVATRFASRSFRKNSIKF